MPSQTRTERFVQQLTGCQTRLSAYIAMLLGDPAAVGDVLQETNLVLWRKADEFADGTDFGAWACTVAKFQVLAYLRDARRDRHLFNEALVGQFSEAAESIVESMEERRTALRRCLEKLTPDQRELVRGRYTLDETISQLSDRLGRSSGGVAMSLSRVRQLLLECIERQLHSEGCS